MNYTLVNIINKQVEEDYFLWLLDRVEMNNHDRLLQYLHSLPFNWVIDMDENRALDGLSLREEFTTIKDTSSVEAFNRACSILEMLVALASRMNDIQAEIGGIDKTSKWFKELLKNLDLYIYSDDSFVEPHDTEEIDEIIDIFMYRKYAKNGEGGLFPLEFPEKDQRKVEIWYQMSQYLIDNYYDDEA